MHTYIILSLALRLISAQPLPTHCWDFANQSGNIPDSCGNGSDLIKQGIFKIIAGTDLCDDSGCKLSNGDGYTTQMPSSLG